ncbi:MAG: AAA family ATPase, partial [Chloroflexi bacterium]|nr:AAA family ATPase [Chloroflexota bacterium]
MPILQIALLGSFQVALDGQPVTAFESDKVRALLAYLAVEADRPHRREALAALLWPDMPETAARSNLRHALANLRRAIHDYDAVPPYLHITRQTIQFNRHSQHTLDTAAFLSEADNPPTKRQREEMVARYHGEFLAGFSIANSAVFEEWAVIKREQLHRRMLHTLRELATIYAQRGQYEQAIPFARQQVELEPWDEAAHQQLIRLLALAGRRSAALTQYENCRRILQAELSIAPTAVTNTLYQNIRDETWPDDIARLPLPRYLVEEREASLPPPFVARDRELAQLNHFLNQTYTRKGRVAFITGEPGSGKTTLMHAFTRQTMAANPDLLVVSGKCSAYTGSGDPYLPFLEIMQMLTGDVESRWEAGNISADHARRLWNVLPDAAEALLINGPLLLDRFIPSAPLLTRAQIRTRSQQPNGAPWLGQLAEWAQAGEIMPAFSPTDLFEQFAGLLKTLARRQPLLLLLDDLQWIDSGSLDLLFHLGRQLRGHRILVLGAYRPGDVAGGRNGQPHPLLNVINEMQQIFGRNQVDLSRAGGRPFINALLDSQPKRLDEQFREMVCRQTGGQALFTTELLRGLQERGDLVKDGNGRWVES